MTQCTGKLGQRGSGDDMWQSQEVCATSYVFPLHWGYGQPVLQVYIRKQTGCKQWDRGGVPYVAPLSCCLDLEHDHGKASLSNTKSELKHVPLVSFHGNSKGVTCGEH